MTLKDSIEIKLRQIGLIKNQPKRILEIMRNDSRHEYLAKECDDCKPSIINRYFQDACRYAVWFIDLAYPKHPARSNLEMLSKTTEICQ